MRGIIRVPFGEGVERADGAFVVRPSAFRDLRNVHLTGGRTEIRRGIEQKALVSGGVTDILAVHPLRAALQSLVVCYNSASRAVTLQRATIDPATLNVTLTAVAGTMWTVPVTAPFPVVSITDSYGKAYIAHDEPSFSVRQPTKVFDPSSATFTDLDYNSGANPMYLRGVKRWLSYVVGWGYGTDDTGPPDNRSRPETLRLSNPGDPDVWTPNYYFNAGQRGEAIVGGAQCAQGFLVAKEGELHLVTGTSRADFDITMVDPNFGAVSGASMVEVDGSVYFWSAEGPRVSNGGPSRDLGLPLDLRGVLPDEILTATDLRYCHGTFRPDREEVEWIFPAAGRDASWSYTLDLKGSSRLWSYRRYSRLIRCTGLLAGNVAFDPGNPAVAPYLVLTSLSANSGSYYLHSVGWDNTNVANLPASSVVEIWATGGASAYASAAELPWVKVKEIAASGASQTDSAVSIGAADTAQPFRAVAVRYRLADGSYYAAQQSTNPMDWPANTRLSVAAPTRPEITGTSLAWGGTPAITTPINVTWNNSNIASLDAGSEVEVWGMGGEFLGGPGIAPDTWQLEATVAASGSPQTRTGITVGQQRRHIALRYKQGGKYYAHSQSSDPWTWPAGSRANILLDGPRPIPTFAWDTSSGFDRSPGTLTWTFPDAALAPTGSWRHEVYVAVWDSSKPWTTAAPAESAWVLASNTTFGGAQPPASVSGSVSTLNSSFKLVYVSRLVKDGLPYPTSYSSLNPTDWPTASRIVVDCI